MKEMLQELVKDIFGVRVQRVNGGKIAGLPLPTYSSTGGPALCNRWLEWGKENGYFLQHQKKVPCYFI